MQRSHHVQYQHIHTFLSLIMTTLEFLRSIGGEIYRENYPSETNLTKSCVVDTPPCISMAECPTSSDHDDDDQNVKTSSDRTKDIKEIKGRIQALKKSVSKGDKKKRKEINMEIAQLEKEIEVMRGVGLSGSKEDCLVDEGSNTVDDTTTIRTDAIVENNTKQMKSKARKKRDNRARKEKEREERITQGTVNEEDTVRYQEMSILLSLLEPLRLTVKDIAPDGNCLYSAFRDQLQRTMNMEVSVRNLREKCSHYIRTHFNDFIPFITNPDTGDLCTKDEFERYCDEIEDPSVWGGQIEIVAISHVYHCPVSVYQAGATPILVGEEYASDKMLCLSYHKHLYSLGKHYNSVIEIK